MLSHHFTIAAILLSVPTLANAAERPVVVELFTSEGCSSCPPADNYLTELSSKRHDVLPLAFHVTYWNDLGWKDPFSLDAATQRQSNYAARFGDAAYTPEMVVDGRTGLVGSDRRTAEAAIDVARQAQSATAPVTAIQKGGTVSISVGLGAGNGRVVLIGYDARHTTVIGRGENGGRTLTESNIVRSIRSVGQWTGAPITLNSPKPSGEEAAVLIEDADGGIIGATRVNDAS